MLVLTGMGAVGAGIGSSTAMAGRGDFSSHSVHARWTATAFKPAPDAAARQRMRALIDAV
jgi:hypothetical protein